MGRSEIKCVNYLIQNMREEQSRRQQFTQGSLSTMLPPSVVSGRQGSLLLQEEISNNSVAIDLEPAMNQQLQQVIQDDTVSNSGKCEVIQYNSTRSTHVSAS